MITRFLWRAFKARYRDQVAEMAVIKLSVRPADIICDIGANKGSYLYWFSRWVPQGRVVAFEPQADLAVYLAKACTALGLRNVLVEAKAVAASSGNLTLYVPGTGDSPGASLNAEIAARESCRTVTVPVVALDDYFEPGAKISVLKIDVEGAELKLFHGAKRILTEQGPVLVFECENRHLDIGTVEDVFQYLRSLGYSGEVVRDGKLHPLQGFDAAVHQKQTGERFWDAKDYFNNFVFRKAAA